MLGVILLPHLLWPIESVAKMLGHTNVQMTRHYARVLDRTVIREMSQIKMDLHFSM